MRKLLLVALVLLLPRAAPADGIDVLLTKLRYSPRAKARLVAALALSTQREHAERVTEPLIRALRDRHRLVRAGAAVALGKLGAFAALPALEDAKSDDDMDVAEQAEKAAKKIAQSLVENLGPFKSKTFGFRIVGLRVDNQFKEDVITALMQHPNVLVGGAEALEEDAPAQERRPDIELALHGQVVRATEKQGTFGLILSLHHGGHTVMEWKALKARGSSRSEMLRALARQVAATVLSYLGAPAT